MSADNLRHLINIFEGDTPEASKLLALSVFLDGRAKDTNAKRQISQKAFIELARSLGVNLTSENLADAISRPPLSNVLEPLYPNSGVVKFKGETEEFDKMPKNDAEEIVKINAKKALTKRS